MKNLFIYSIFFISCGVFAANEYQAEKFKQYFTKNFAKEYQKPKGKIADIQQISRLNKKHAKHHADDITEPTTVILADFNQDGVNDKAELFFHNSKRSSGWNLDLIIMYSENEEIKHTVFTYAGQFSSDASDPIKQSLILKNSGFVEYPQGKFKIDRPTILAYRQGKLSVAYYWNGQAFIQQALDIDD